MRLLRRDRLGISSPVHVSSVWFSCCSCTAATPRTLLNAFRPGARHGRRAAAFQYDVSMLQTNHNIALPLQFGQRDNKSGSSYSLAACRRACAAAGPLFILI